MSKSGFKLRRYQPQDAEKIDEIYNRCHGHYNLPSIKHCTSLAVVEKDGQIIALGAIQLIPEFILVLDQDVSKKDQVVALKELMEAGEVVAQLQEFTDVYTFPDSNSYANILEKHFGFKRGDTILTKRLNNGE